MSRRAGTALRVLPATLVLLGAVPPATGAAQTPDRGLFGIAPSKVLLKARPPRGIRPLQVTNTTRRTYDVKIFAAPLRQAPDGGLSYDSSAAGRALARRTVTLSDDHLTMGPSSRRELSVRWLRTFPGQRVAPIGIVVQGVPGGLPSTELAAKYRLVATYLLALPGGRAAAELALDAAQGPKRTLAFTTTVRNTGETYALPHDGKLIVRDATGTTVTRASFQGNIVLPGAQRPFVVVTRKLLPKGRYTATTSMVVAGRRRSATHPFVLVGPNQLPTTDLRIVELRAEGQVGDPARVTLTVSNTGNVDADATVAVDVAPRGAQGGGPPARAKLTRRLAPGKRSRVELDVGRLRAGDVTIRAEASARGQSLDSEEITLTPRAKHSLPSRFRGFLADNLAIVLIVLIALVIVVAALASNRRYRRRLLYWQAIQSANDDDNPA